MWRRAAAARILDANPAPLVRVRIGGGVCGRRVAAALILDANPTSLVRVRTRALQPIQALDDLRDPRGDTGLFDKLSPEVFLKCVEFLGYGDRLKLANLVCKSFRCLLSEPSAWKEIGFAEGGYRSIVNLPLHVSQMVRPRWADHALLHSLTHPHPHPPHTHTRTHKPLPPA